ncbi:MAG: MoaD/ThiS family protein [Propionibacteriaceae bacterium]|nr:MoaD/ThiS family protein [Propionibacteriaceae bacterium]
MDVRFYAGAADAAGRHLEEIPGPLSVDALLAQLGSDRPALAKVLTRCSILVDGRQVADPSTPLPTDARVDVLPPFAGG